MRDELYILDEDGDKEMFEMYCENSSFFRYCNEYCKKHKTSLETCFKAVLVKEVFQMYLENGYDDIKSNKTEIACGC